MMAALKGCSALYLDVQVFLFQVTEPLQLFYILSSAGYCDLLESLLVAW